VGETAVICTQLPGALRQAANVWDARRIERELPRLEPVIPIPFEPEHVAETLGEFGEVVDLIEGSCFAPDGLAMLTRAFARRHAGLRLGDLPALRCPFLVSVVPRVRGRGEPGHGDALPAVLRRLRG